MEVVNFPYKLRNYWRNKKILQHTYYRYNFYETEMKWDKLSIILFIIDEIFIITDSNVREW